MTIFALSSGVGKAGVAVIRISGPQTQTVLCQILRKALPQPRVATLRSLYSPASGEILDRGLILWFPAPASFTGEDMAELHVHGGRAVVSSIFETLSSAGLRLAEPGEFSKRAFENGKIDLTEAEGLADLINAETSAQRQQALIQSLGAQSLRYEEWRSRLLQAMAFVESSLDFSDEADVAENAFNLAVPIVHDLLAELRCALNDGKRGEIIRSGIQVAIVGAPNVGKSSLLNALVGREAAIVFDRPGTTRDVIEVALDLDGYPFVFRDTAGLRQSDDAVEQEGIRRSRHVAASADVVLFVEDATNRLPLHQVQSASWIEARESEGDLSHSIEAAPTTLLIFNKIDIALSTSLPKDAVCLSAKTGEGLQTLKARLVGYARENLRATDTPLITRARHRQELEAARLALQMFLEESKTGLSTELLAEHLREAATALGRLTGRVDVEDVLGQIFADFCIGK